MRRLFVLALPALVGLAAAARAGDGDGKCKTRYLVPPPADNPSCPCPCDKRMSLCVMGRDHAHKYVDKLSCDQPCCARIKAVKKLGARRIPREGPADGSAKEIWALPSALSKIEAGSPRDPNPL